MSRVKHTFGIAGLFRVFRITGVRLGIVILAGCLIISACEPGMGVKVQTNNPPKFALAGDSFVADFFVCCEDKEASVSHEQAVWEIEPEHANGRRASEIHLITYGVVPPGYFQVRPQQGAAPPPLLDGPVYHYSIAGNPTGTGGIFTVTSVKGK